ncbi:hypothetical protein PY365_20245 [Roseiarcaceae bacterium H3SJ34-1]|uniref:hypothetical protein n=1 Tax=Terripilifer ovatus TaxID=3032367 RepID=UPI003AB965A4|nr:hypothetical protein [Roseiarcaceae bacterium H3SJ34-1]
MRPTKKILSMLAGIAIMTGAGGTAFAQVNGHRPSDHTLDATNHPFKASYPDANVRESGSVAKGYTTITPADRALQRAHDIKQQTSDAGVQPSSGPAGMIPVLTPRDRELMRLGAEKDRMTGG